MRFGRLLGPSAVVLLVLVLGGCPELPGPGDGAPKVRTPAVAETQIGFIDSAELHLSCADPADAAIRYTLDGTDPTESSTLCSGPITVTVGGEERVPFTLKAKAYSEGYEASDTFSREYLVVARPEPPEMLVAGDFEDGEFFWGCSVHADAGGEGVVEVRDGQLQATPTATSTNIWAVESFYTGGFTLEQGKCYEVSFDAWAEAPRALAFLVRENARDLNEDGYAYTFYIWYEFPLTTEPKNYVWPFNMAHPTDDSPVLLFCFAIDTGTVHVDNISMKERPPQVIEDYETRIPDPNLRAALEEACGKGFGEITDMDLANLPSLDWSRKPEGQRIANLTGIDLCVALWSLDVTANEIDDISPLADTITLSRLNICQNWVDDLTPLLALPTLTAIMVNRNSLNLADLSVINPGNFPKLREIGLAGTDNAGDPVGVTCGQATSLLEAFSDLGHISLWNFQDMGDAGFGDLYDSVLEGSAASLGVLQIGACGIGDASIELMGGLTDLRELQAWDNHIADISPLENLGSLNGLGLGGNEIADLAPLRALHQAGGLVQDPGEGVPYVDVTYNGLDLSEETPNRLVVDYLLEHGVAVEWEPQE